MIKKIRFELTTKSYAEMGHLTFYKDDVPLVFNEAAATLTLADGQTSKITASASSVYTLYPAIYAFSKNGPEHNKSCWCANAVGNGWIEFDFTPALPDDFANKITFCCGQGEGYYPATYTLFFIDENKNKKQMMKPLYVNKHNGIFENWNIIRCMLGKNKKYYFLKPKDKR